jgi:hypothetical protein
MFNLWAYSAWYFVVRPMESSFCQGWVVQNSVTTILALHVNRLSFDMKKLMKAGKFFLIFRFDLRLKSPDQQFQ